MLDEKTGNAVTRNHRWDYTQEANLAEIAISYSRSKISDTQSKIHCSRDADRILRNIFPSLEHREYFYMLCIDRSNQVLGYYQVSVGGIAWNDC